MPPPAPPAEPAPVESRRQTYLIGNNPNLVAQGASPVDIGVLEDALKRDPDIDFHRTLSPGGLVGVLSANGGSALSVAVATMPTDRAEQLESLSQLVVEPDHPLSFGVPPPPSDMATRDPAVVLPYGATFTTTIAVLAPDGTGLSDAEVFIFGSFLPVQGSTDDTGHVTLSLRGESPATLRGLYVNPKLDYWSVYIASPALQPDGVNVVTPRPLSNTFTDFPADQIVGWGQKVMGITELSSELRGQGARVAVIDSGAASTTHHDLLNQVKAGFDITTHDANTWDVDTVMHGSHCLGIIAGINDQFGIRGFAPEAEIHVFKIFPGGRFSDLIEALDSCIESQIDVVNLSLGSDQPSQLLQQRLQLARDAGVACFVAAGNSSGAVQYPAAYPEVMAVAAVGQAREFPPESYCSTLATPDSPVSPDGYFSPKFTCHGPEVDVCAPGVAIVSSVPPNNFAAWDGTSMATPHVTGVAALVVAHHPDFQGEYRSRNSARVDRLFEIVKSSAAPLDLGDPGRTGAGIPRATAALAAAASAPAPQPQDSAGPGAPDLGQLEALLEQAGLLPGGVRPASAGVAAPAAGGQSTSAAQLDALEEALRDAGLPVGG